MSLATRDILKLKLPKRAIKVFRFKFSMKMFAICRVDFPFDKTIVYVPVKLKMKIYFNN